MLTVNNALVLDVVRKAGNQGATQMEVFKALTEGLNLDEEAIGLAMQATSRCLSQMAKDGELDDSRRQGPRHIYAVPAGKLAGRSTRNEALQAEVERLKVRVKELEDARDCVVEQNERLKDQISEMHDEARERGESD